MASGTSGRTVFPDEEGDESSMVSDQASIQWQASLPRTSSVVSEEDVGAGDDLSAGMEREPSLPVASSKSSEIIEAEASAHPSPGMEPSFQTTVSSMRDPAEDEPTSTTGSTSSTEMKDNPFMEDPPEDNNALQKYLFDLKQKLKNNPFMEDLLRHIDALQKHFSALKQKLKKNPFMKDLPEDNDALQKYFFDLKQKLKVGLQKETVYAFLDHDVMPKFFDHSMAKVQEKVQELFDLFEAIEAIGHVIKMMMEILVRETKIARKDLDQQNFEEYVCQTDIYYHLFIHALECANSKLEDTQHNIHVENSDHMIVAFMAFLINKVQEEDIKDPSLTFPKMYQEAKTKVTNYLRLYEEETISAFICLVNNDETQLANYFFKCLLALMKPSDIINRGRVYNYALQKAEKLHEVHKFLVSLSLSPRYEFIVQDNGGLTALKMRSDQDKVRKFLGELYHKDVDLQREIGSIWDFVEQHDYPYLMKYVWEYEGYNRETEPDGYIFTPLQMNYIFTSSAAMTVGGKDIMQHLLRAWPALVNTPYKGVAALHVAVIKGNEEAIEFLFEQKELDINVRTGRLLIVTDEVKRRHQNRIIKQKEVDMHQQTGEPGTRREILKHEEALRTSKGVMNCRGDPLPYASAVVGDREEMFEDLFRQLGVEGNLDSQLSNAAKFTQINQIAEKKWNKNRWNCPTYQTALHIATTQANSKATRLLSDAPEYHQKRLRCREEDEEDRTPLDILYGGPKKVTEDFDLAEIEKILLSKQDVQDGITRMLQIRQSLVEAVNTILVGAALIASVTFVGWLQPPLGYAEDYDHAVPYPAPPGTFDSYLPVQGNLGMKAFALFNSISFFFGIATVIVGADATFPQKTNKYIGHTIQEMRALLRHAIQFFIISLVCVLGAFGSAAIVVLPPSLFFRKDFVLSIIIGGGVCGYSLWRLLSRHSKKMQRINGLIPKLVLRINKFINPF